MTPIYSRPELDAYWEAVNAAKQEGTVIEPGAFWLGALALGLLLFSMKAQDWGVLVWASGITFSIGLVFALAAVMLSFKVVSYPGVARRLGIAHTKLAEHMGWTWVAVETDKAGHPLTPGRMSGEEYGLPFVMETSASHRELRFILPERDLGEPSARDFYDLHEVETERRWRNSPNGFRTANHLLKGELGRGLGTDGTVSLEGNTLRICCKPHSEKGLSADANIERRMAEANAVHALAEAARDDWLAEFVPGQKSSDPDRIATPR